MDVGHAGILIIHDLSVQLEERERGGGRWSNLQVAVIVLYTRMKLNGVFVKAPRTATGPRGGPAHPES